jgi:hypothetical protein
LAFYIYIIALTEKTELLSKKTGIKYEAAVLKSHLQVLIAGGSKFASDAILHLPL